MGGKRRKRTDGRPAYENTLIHNPSSKSAGDLLTVISEVISADHGVGKKIDVRKTIDANLRLLAAEDPSVIEQILDHEKDNLPFLAAAGGTLQPFAYLPVEIPTTLNLLEFSGHPEYYPDIKHGIIDELLQMAAVGTHWRGKKWFFVKESYVNDKGETIALKDGNGELVKIKGSNRTTLSEKINEWWKAQLEYKEALNPKALLSDRERLRRTYAYMQHSTDILHVGKYKEALKEIWDIVQHDIRAGKVDMSVAEMGGMKLCHLWIRKDGVIWSMNVKTSVKGGKLTFEGITQFFGVIGGTKEKRQAYMKAAQSRKTQVGLDNVEVVGTSMIDDMPHNGVVIFARTQPFVGEAKPIVPCKNSGYLANFFKGAFAFGALNGMLEGIHSYVKGGSIYDALKAGAATAVASTVLGVGSAWLLKKITEYGLQKFAVQFATYGTLKNAIRWIPYIGWAWTAWEVGSKVSEIVATYKKEQYESYYEKTKLEFDGAYEGYRDPESAYHQDIQIKQKQQGSLQIRGVRWKTDGAGGYDSLIRSARVTDLDNYSAIEFGEEVLLNIVMPFNPNANMPFVPYLPKSDEYTEEENRRVERLFANLAVIDSSLKELKTKLDDNKYWVSKSDEEEFKKIMAQIESAKASIGVYDNVLCTKWAHCKTTKGGSMYWWCDFRGQSYMMIGPGSKSRPDAEETMAFISQIRNHFQLT